MSETTTLARRLSPEASRETALRAARDLLIEAGPQAVTLKAVAQRVGRTHANLLHHFGSASGLQKALAEMMADAITAKIGAAAIRARRGGKQPREVVDMTFEAFDTEGAGALASWMILTGNEDALDPIVAAIHRLVDDLSHAAPGAPIPADTLHLVLTALGDALLGGSMTRALGLPRDAARRLALDALMRTRGGV